MFIWSDLDQNPSAMGVRRRKPTTISLLRFIGSVFVLCLFLSLFVLHINEITSLESFCGGATVFLVTFYRVLPFLLFVSVDFGVNCKC